MKTGIGKRLRDRFRKNYTSKTLESFTSSLEQHDETVEDKNIDITTEDIKFLQQYEQSVNAFARNEAEKHTGHQLADRYAPQITLNINKTTREFHLDNEYQGEYTAVMGLSEGSTEIIRRAVTKSASQALCTHP